MGTFLALDQAPAIMGTLFILDLARHLFIRQKPRFILFIMPSLGPKDIPGMDVTAAPAG